MRDGIVIELARQRPQCGAHLRGARDACFQGLIVRPAKGQLFAAAARARGRAGDLQLYLRNDRALLCRARAVKHHHPHAGLGRGCALIRSLTRAVAAAAVPRCTAIARVADGRTGICRCGKCRHMPAPLYRHQADLPVRTAGGQAARIEDAKIVERGLGAARPSAAVGHRHRARHARMKHTVSIIVAVHHVPQEQRVVPARRVGRVAHFLHSAVVAAAIFPR